MASTSKDAQAEAVVHRTTPHGDTADLSDGNVNLVLRPPRVIEPPPQGKITIPSPPKLQEEDMPIWLSLLPLLAVVAYLPMILSGGGMLVGLIGMLIMSVGVGLATNLYRKSANARKRRREYIAYMELLDARVEVLEDIRNRQRRILLENHPDILPNTARHDDGSLSLKEILADRLNPRPSLWIRRPEDYDFVALRIGKGKAFTTIELQTPSLDELAPAIGDYNSAKELAEEYDENPSSHVQPWSKRLKAEEMPNEMATYALQVSRKYLWVPDVPIVMDLKEVGSVGFAGKRDLTTSLVRAMLCQLAVHHAPTEARIYLFGNENNKSDWEWIKYLPHNSAVQRGEVNNLLAFDQAGAQRLGSILMDELGHREASLYEYDESSQMTPPPMPVPYLIVIVDDPDVAESEGAIARILADGKRMGASCWFIVNQVRDVPGQCGAYVELIDGNNKAGRPGFIYEVAGEEGIKLRGLADQVQTFEADTISKEMSNLVLKDIGGDSDMPTLVDFLQDIWKVDGVDKLRDMVEQELWARGPGKNGRLPYPVPIGLNRAGKPMIIDLWDQADGPHGLIGGTTGSGKSELLQSMICSLAVSHDPRLVNFVLIDYKGGSAFEAFRSLPHTVGMVTDLQGHLGTRALIGLQGEIERRKRRLLERNAKDIDSFNSSVQSKDEVLPHLFIIIDEFAELVKELPEFMDGLIQVARVGRSLGVHLILATQRPAGVVRDDIRANTQFSICLRVNSPEDSREVILRPDAAFLPHDQPGRAYFKVGNRLTLFQSAYTGGEYLGDEKAEDIEPDSASPVLKKLPDGSLEPIYMDDEEKPQTLGSDVTPPDKAEFAKPKTVAKAVVDMLKTLALDDLDIPKRTPIWPEPLEREIYLEDITSPVEDRWDDRSKSWRSANDASPWMCPTIGLEDDPANQEQRPLRIDLGRTGHMIVFGMSGSGKSVLLRTMLVSLACAHPPDELNIYILDFGNRALLQFKDLPHVSGNVFVPYQSEQILRLFGMLEDIMENRKRILGNSGAETIAEYNRSLPDRDGIEPAICLVIDNYAEFKAQYEHLEGSLARLIRDGRACGIHVLISADQLSSVPYKIMGSIEERLALYLAESGDYSSIVGRIGAAKNLEMIPGRGFRRGRTPPLEFQVALPTKGDISKLIADMADAAKRADIRRPRTIGTLPTILRLHDLFDEHGLFRQDVPASAGISAPIGLDDLTLEPIEIDFSRPGHILVTGPPRSGKTNLLCSLVLSLAERYPPDRVKFILIDPRQGLLSDLMWTLPHVIKLVEDMTDLTEVAEIIEEEMIRRSEVVKAERMEATRAGKRFRQSETTGKFYRLMVVFDDLTSSVTSEDFGAMGASQPPHIPALLKMGTLAKSHAGLGLHLIITGNPADLNMIRNREPIKSVKSGRNGIVLCDREILSQMFGINFKPIGIGGQQSLTPLPAGRGFLVREGVVTFGQFAMVEAGMGDPLGQTYKWVERISGRDGRRSEMTRQ